MRADARGAGRSGRTRSASVSDAVGMTSTGDGMPIAALLVAQLPRQLQCAGDSPCVAGVSASCMCAAACCAPPWPCPADARSACSEQACNAAGSASETENQIAKRYPKILCRSGRRIATIIGGNPDFRSAWPKNRRRRPMAASLSLLTGTLGVAAAASLAVRPAAAGAGAARAIATRAILGHEYLACECTKANTIRPLGVAVC